MATLSVTVAVLFFLLTVSHARTPSRIDVIDPELPKSRPDSYVNSILRLSSETVNAESHSNEPARDVIPESEESERVSLRSVPLRFVRFRPINRHFPIKSRFRVRRCHHHHGHGHGHPFFKPMRQHVEIPYGNDMILSTSENSDFDPIMFHHGPHGGMRRIPPKWIKIYDHHDHLDENEIMKFLFKHKQRFGEDKFKKHLHHKDDDEENEEDRVKEAGRKREGKKEEGGFVKRIRKFLDHF